MLPKSAEISPDPIAIASELERIAASTNFRKAERCVRLLRYLTRSAIEGRGSELKEYTLGVAVFERPDSFDPRTDPIVRLEARRLRLKLAEYYQHNGLDDAVVIELPKGAYVPCFRLRAVSDPQPAAAAPVKPAAMRWLPWLTASVAVLSLSVAGWYLLRSLAERAAVRPSIAVLGFRDLSPARETSWMDPAVTELIGIELGAGQKLYTVPPENVARMRLELSIPPDPEYRAQLLQRIGADLGIDYAVAGAFQPRGDRVRFDVALFDVRSGRQIAAIGEEAAQDKLLALAQDCAARIRAQLGIRLPPLQGPVGFPPAERAAMESYARGMERLRQGDALGARSLLENAAVIAPENALVHSGLAAALSMLGLDNMALQEAKRAFDSSNALGRVEQLEIEGRYREIDHDWPRAIQVYQALFTLSPDDLEYGLLLISAQTRGGKAQDALATVSALRKLPAQLRDDPRIDMAEAQSAGALADFAHTRRAAHAAAVKASKRNARLQYAHARLLEAGAMQNLHLAGFADVRAEARGICADLGDRVCVAAAYRIEANAMVGLGSPAAALPLYQEVLEISNQTGNLLEKLNAITGIAYVENLQGDLKAAERDYRAAMTVASEMGPEKRYPLGVDLGDVLAAQGRIAEAVALGKEALADARQSGDQESTGTSLALLAHTLALQGKFPESIAQYEDAVRILRVVNDPWDLALALFEMGDAQLAGGNLAEARKTFEETRDIDRKHGGFTPLVDFSFARLALASGRPEESATLARNAMSAFAAGGREGDRLQAAALLARALIARGNIGEAAGVLAQIPSPEGRAFPVESVFQFRIARFLVAANAGRRTEATQGIDRIAAEVSRLGMPPLENETRLARAAVMKTVATSSVVAH